MNRGQTLVLFALTLLLLALMVLVTLGINRRIQQRVELQTVADVSAYSDAVATARAFNAVSLMNRAIVSQMVSVTGVASLASWASVYYSTIANAQADAERQLSDLSSQQALACRLRQPQCRCLSDAAAFVGGRLLPALQAERARLDQLYRVGHVCESPAWQVRGLQQYASEEIRSEQRAVLLELEKTVLGRQAYAARAAALASARPLELSAARAQDAVSLREVRDGTNCLGGGLGCETLRDDVTPLPMILAAMGSRGDGFLTGRAGASKPLLDQWEARVFGATGGAWTVIGGDGGSGYWDGRNHHARGVASAAGADDHFAAVAQVTPPGACGAFTLNIVGSTWVTPSVKIPPTHFIAGVGDDGEPRTHWMYGQGPAFGLWPRSVLYDDRRVDLEPDAFGQPKLLAVLERDLSAHRDPWQLDVTILGGRFDDRAPGRQGALATGLAYYHRAGHFREPPNLLNPFWRATLVSSDVDAQAAADLPRTLDGTAVAQAGAVYRGLMRAGFKGVQ
jgi:hypothetical protein